MDILPEMACNLATNCNFLFGFFSFNLPEDKIDVGLTVNALHGIHTFKRYINTKMTKCSPWVTEIKPFPSLQKKMTEYCRQRQANTNPSTNRSNQFRPKATSVRRCKLVTTTRPHKDTFLSPESSIWDTIPNLFKGIGLP